MGRPKKRLRQDIRPPDETTLDVLGSTGDASSTLDFSNFDFSNVPAVHDFDVPGSNNSIWDGNANLTFGNEVQAAPTMPGLFNDAMYP